MIFVLQKQVNRLLTSISSAKDIPAVIISMRGVTKETWGEGTQITCSAWAWSDSGPSHGSYTACALLSPLEDEVTSGSITITKALANW